MSTSDHFIFTAAKTEAKTGYQVIAKSSGITDEIILELDDYLYPIGVNVSEFIESRSLLKIKNEKIAYSIIKNIGKGYDGRSGTLYNQTFVIDKEEFRKLDFDSRVFDDYLIEDDSIRGNLKTLEIEYKYISPDFRLLENLGHDVLKSLLHSIFKRNKIALVKTDNFRIIQNVLAIVPPSMRLMEFSTMVNQPNRQYRYRFIQVPEEAQPSLERNFVIINPNDPKSLSKRHYVNEESVNQLIQIILDKDEKQLNKIYKDFEKLPARLTKVRRIKVEEVFDQAAYVNLASKHNFGKLKNKVKQLYSNRKFNEASPTLIVLITKKLRKMIVKSLSDKKYKKRKNYVNLEQISLIVIPMLDCMHYLHDHSEKQMGRTLKNEILSEITKLEELLEEYDPIETVETPYMFNLGDYLRWQFEQGVKNVQNGIAVTLYLMTFLSRHRD